MNVPYSLRIVGHPPKNMDLSNSVKSVQMFTFFLWEGFRKIGIDVKITDISNFQKEDFLDGPTDVILAHTYHSAYTTWIAPLLEENPGTCRLSASFMETMFPTNLCFTFQQRLPYPMPKYPQEIVIPAPCLFRLLPVIRKMPKSVLVDHSCTAKKELNWTDRLFSVLSSLPDDHSLAAIQGGSSNPPPRFKRLPPLCFPEYVEATADYETFVVTHAGSYNASVVDMLARGTRVLAPKGFVPRFLVRRFQIIEFNDPEEVVPLILNPYDEKKERGNRELCTDMDEAVRMMDGVIRECLEKN